MKNKEELTEQETFRRLVVELRTLESKAEILQSGINMRTAELTQLYIANTTLKELEKENTGSKLFVPIGGGSYIKADLGNVETVLVGMGANVAVEKTLKEAEDIVKKRITNIEKERNVLNQELREVLNKIYEDRENLEIVGKKLSEGRRPPDVRKTESRA